MPRAAQPACRSPTSARSPDAALETLAYVVLGPPKRRSGSKLHYGSKRGSLEVDPTNRRWFQRNPAEVRLYAGGGAIELVAEVEGLDWRGAVGRIAEAC